MPNNTVFRRPFTKRGQNWLPPTQRTLIDVVGSGGVEVGGSATVQFVHAGQVASDVVLEWDLDNDGDFGEPVENLTPYVLAAETFTGRDWPSLLTGKAGPGKLRATLRNDDDRFNFFNTGSPLVADPYSLRTGRKLRIRVAEAANPDPVLLAKDRFRRAAGALDVDELGSTYVEPVADDFAILANRAVATGEGDPHMAVVDAGSADHFVQVKVSVIGDATPANRVGVVYRYVDASNYSLCVLDAGGQAVQLLDVVAGVETVVASRSVEVYSGVTVGVLADGDTATAYAEGVPLFTGAAPNPSAIAFGFYAEWVTGDARPEVDEFFAWDGIPAQAEGVLWTGDVSDLVSSVQAGPEKAAAISGEGWLSKLSSQEITPPNSAVGRKTGLLMGNALAKALLIHPPGRIDEGDVTTGIFAMPERSALAVARDVEETELGFMYETQEGPIAFRARSHRDGSTPLVTFSDAPGAQFGYHRVEPYDSRKEVFNRVSAGVSSWVEGTPTTLFTDPGPYVLGQGQTQTLTASYNGIVARWTGHTRDVITPAAPANISAVAQASGSAATSSGLDLPATVDAGDLLLILFAGPWNKSVPSGWTGLRTTAPPYVIAKVADGSEDGTTVTVNGTSGYWADHVYRVQDWYGDLDGVTVGLAISSTGSSAFPWSVSPTWGVVPTLFIAAYSTTSGTTQTGIPFLYGDGLFASGPAGGIAVGSARRITATSVESPEHFSLGSSVGWAALTIAVRGSESTTTAVSGALPSGADPAFTISYDDDVTGTAVTVASEDFEDSTLSVTVLSGTWARDSFLPHAGSWSYRSATIGHNGVSDVVIQVPATASTVQFWYRVSSENNFDFFRFYVDGVQKFAVSSSGFWEQSASFDVSTASTVTFRYSKDGSGSSGSDAAWIDDLVFSTVSQSHQNIQVQGIPLVQGDQTFAQVDDYPSQDEHNAIRTYQNSANLFVNNTDAEAYASLVLAKYADDRPIVALSFYASKSPAYRAQALRRRVGDRISMVADNNTGFGITRDFFIESVTHKWSHGTRLWETTWELSPA